MGGNTWAKRPSTATLICPRSPRGQGNKQKLARSIPRMQRVAGRRGGRLSDRTLGSSLSFNKRDTRMSARAFAPQRTRGRGRSRADAHPPGFAGRFATTVLTSGRLVRSAAAQASSLQAWPTRHVRLIVPFVPGGAADVIARVLGNRLSEAWGQQVVVENAAGPAPISAPRS